MTELHLAEGSREALLLARLDAAWAEFAAGLPARLRALAGRACTFRGAAGGEEPFGGPSTMNPGLTCTPWLFWEMVSGLDDEALVELAFGGSLVVLASVLLDHLVDAQAGDVGETILLHQALYEAGSTRIRERMHGWEGGTAGFWREFDRLGAEHVAGLAAERECRAEPERLTLERFLEFVPVKFSPIAVTMAALLHAVGRPEWLAPVETSIKALAVASQLLDDVGDWEEDLAERRLTYFLSQAAPAEAWRAAEWPAREAVQTGIDAGWADIRAMETVQAWLDRALEAVAGLECVGWKAYLGGYRALAGEHVRRFRARWVMRVIEGVRQPSRT